MTHQLVADADNVNLLGENVNTIQRKLNACSCLVTRLQDYIIM